MSNDENLNRLETALNSVTDLACGLDTLNRKLVESESLKDIKAVIALTEVLRERIKDANIAFLKLEV